MPRACSVCNHSERAAIDEALRGGEPYRSVAKQFAASEQAVFRHKQGHSNLRLVRQDEAGRSEGHGAKPLYAGELWERRRGESAKAFAAFRVYRDLGPRRSTTAAYRLYVAERQESGGGRKGAIRAPGRWKFWAQQYEWKNRAEAYDAHLDREARLRREAELRAMDERHLALARSVQALLARRLQEFDPRELTPPVIIRWLETAVMLERLVMELPTKSVTAEAAAIGGRTQDRRGGGIVLILPDNGRGRVSGDNREGGEEEDEESYYNYHNGLGRPLKSGRKGALRRLAAPPLPSTPGGFVGRNGPPLKLAITDHQALSSDAARPTPAGLRPITGTTPNHAASRQRGDFCPPF
jgi:hypothetical protein